MTEEDSHCFPEIPTEQDVDLPKRKRRQSNRRRTLVAEEEQRTMNRSRSICMGDPIGRSIWSNVSEDQADDFFCIKENPLLPDYERRKRMSAVPIIPAKRPLVEAKAVIDESTIDFSYLVGRGDSLDIVKSKLDETFTSRRMSLGSLLSMSSEMMEIIMNLSERYRLLSWCEKKGNRIRAVKQFLYHDAEVRQIKHQAETVQSHIRIIAAFEDFLASLPPDSLINYARFEKDFLAPETEVILKLNTRVQRLKAASKPLVSTITHNKENILRSENEKSGRILQRYTQALDELNYPDVEVIMKALVTKEMDLPFVRQVIFNIAWEKFMFPFSDVEITEFPDILHYTPRIFSPENLPEWVLDTTFNELNSKDWPFRSVSLGLFELLVQTDPFVIAERYWDLYEKMSTIAHKLAVEGGTPAEDVALGFDTMFQYALIILFAFGVSEILEVMKFAGSFIEYVEDNHQQFAMTSFIALTTYIEKIKHRNWKTYQRKNSE